FEAAAREDFVEREQTAGFVGTARDGAAGKNDCHLARAEGSHGGIPFLDDRDAPVADEPLLERHRKLVSASRCGRANSRYKFAILETMNEREREFEAFVREMAGVGVRPLSERQRERVAPIGAARMAPPRPDPDAEALAALEDLVRGVGRF